MRVVRMSGWLGGGEASADRAGLGGARILINGTLRVKAEDIIERI